MAKRKPPVRSTVDIDDVLAGREKPSALELLDLIHRENPTGRALGVREGPVRPLLLGSDPAARHGPA